MAIDGESFNVLMLRRSVDRLISRLVSSCENWKSNSENEMI